MAIIQTFQLFNDNLDFETEEEEHPPISSICSHNSLNEFDTSDHIIIISFPQVYLLVMHMDGQQENGQQYSDIIYLDSLHLFLQRHDLYWDICLMY